VPVNVWLLDSHGKSIGIDKLYTKVSLADGKLQTSKGTLLPAVVETRVMNITYVNTDSLARTVNLYIKRDGANSIEIISPDLSLVAGGMLVDTRLHTLEAGDVIEGDASVADVVKYSISGVKEA